MQARIDQAQPLISMDSLEIGNRGGCNSVGAFVRNWGPYILTAIVVPGGIVLAVLLLWRQWNQKRQALVQA